MNKQRGFSLMSVTLSLIVISVMLIGFTNFVVTKIDKRNANEFRVHIENVIEEIQQYQYFMVTENGFPPMSSITFPADLEGLMSDYPNQFWPICSIADEQAGLCKRPDGLPWSNLKVGYNVIFGGAPSLPTVVLTFPLSTAVIDVEQRAKWVSELQRIPFSKTLANGDIEITIHDPLIMNIYKAFLRTDGTTELTDTWDVGNQPIVNANAVSIRTQDNKQQRLGVGIVSKYLGQNGDVVLKNSWSCADGLRQTLHLEVNSISAENGEKYVGLGTFRPSVIENSTNWRVYLDYNVKIKSGNSESWKKRHSGYITISKQCSI